MPIAAFGQKQRPSQFFMTPPRLPYTPLQSSVTDNDPLLRQSPWRSKISGSDTETLGGFPVEFLIQVVRIALNILVICFLKKVFCVIKVENFSRTKYFCTFKNYCVGFKNSVISNKA